MTIGDLMDVLEEKLKTGEINRLDNPNERTQAHGITEAFECGGYIVMWTA